MKPFIFTIFVITSNHFTKRYSLTETVQRIIFTAVGVDAPTEGSGVFTSSVFCLFTGLEVAPLGVEDFWRFDLLTCFLTSDPLENEVEANDAPTDPNLELFLLDKMSLSNEKSSSSMTRRPSFFNFSISASSFMRCFAVKNNAVLATIHFSFCSCSNFLKSSLILGYS
ncbi:hypothetical protein WICMUC_001817 [Wickerhamomyces mucosus]|uniref:Uncharacterized protein n=1 Tax=Wickerhamomyces mucosus TaxID=1378264 RepID=A0A9P8TFR2_9ASCO|nr:hypothetical protein WICMUC_001817 [Wickerhamomyces mucosus]